MKLYRLVGDGMGSGKSTVAGIFEESGIYVVRADHLARELVRPGQPVLKTIVERFGPSILKASGALDRRRFIDRAERAALYEIFSH